MYEPATPSQTSVDSRSTAASLDWNGHAPVPDGLRARVPDVSRSWFEAVMSKSARMRQVTAWRFTCPFCGEKNEHEHHSEVYAWAYRHLAVCDWVMDPLWTGVLE